MKGHLFAWSAVVCLFFTTSVYAQVGVSLPTFTNTDPGQVLEMPVTVVNFDTVFSVQFVVQWDPAVLEFQSVVHPNNPLAIVDSLCFNLLEAGEGIIRFRWYSTLPKTLPDGADVFRLKMKVIGAIGTSTNVAFTELPPVTYFEIVRGPGSQFYTLATALLTQGAVSVGVVSANEPGASLSLKATPNPFSISTQIQFDLPESGVAHIWVTDLAGKIIFSEKKYHNRGINGTVIANTELRSKGLYFVHVTTAGTHAVQPIVFQ